LLKKSKQELFPYYFNRKNEQNQKLTAKSAGGRLITNWLIDSVAATSFEVIAEQPTKVKTSILINGGNSDKKRNSALEICLVSSLSSYF